MCGNVGDVGVGGMMIRGFMVVRFNPHLWFFFLKGLNDLLVSQCN